MKTVLSELARAGVPFVESCPLSAHSTFRIGGPARLALFPKTREQLLLSLSLIDRAELPLWYTQGFNPHPKLVFGLPLPIGCESVCEMADIKLVRDMPAEDIPRQSLRNIITISDMFWQNLMTAEI